MIKKLLFSLSLTGVLVLSLAGLAMAAPGGVTDAAALQELATVRQVTAKYHDVNAALADGFISTEECAAEPGVGAMGIHYVNFARVVDPSINAAEPEVLLYLPTGDGLRLVGAEYLLALGPLGAPVPPVVPPAPELFGRTFDGPMPGHSTDQPPHYELHVWLWQANPSGIFDSWNPNLSCP